MSGLFDSELVVSVGNRPTLIYQPASDGVGMSCLMTNSSAGILPLSVWITRGLETINLAVSVPLEPGVPYDVFAGSKVALKASDEIFAQCPVSDAISGILSAYKDQ